MLTLKYIKSSNINNTIVICRVLLIDNTQILATNI